jgi:hypothetical protein
VGSNRIAGFAVIAAAAMSPVGVLAQQRNFITPGLTLQPKQSVAKPFVFRIPTPTAIAPATQLDTTTTVICGMKVIHPDPNIDPGFEKKPERSQTTFTLKIVRPPVCATP